jgi:hypothetical protein
MTKTLAEKCMDFHTYKLREERRYRVHRVIDLQPASVLTGRS